MQQVNDFNHPFSHPIIKKMFTCKKKRDNNVCVCMRANACGYRQKQNPFYEKNEIQSEL